jgi:hypothetical protein
MSKFLERLNEGKEAKEAKANELVAANAKAQVEQKISGLKAQAATLAAAYNSALGSSSFSIDRVFALTAEIESNSKNLALAEAILSTEF